MKIINYSWWIGAIIGAVLALAFTGGPAEDKTGMLVLVGLGSGALWGGIIGLIIDYFRNISSKKASSPNLNKENITQTTVPDFPPVGQRKFASLSAECAFMQASIITKNHTMKDIVMELFQNNADDLIANYRRKNKTELEDPLLGPIKLINYINTTSEELKKSLLLEKETFGLTTQNVDDIIAKIHKRNLNRNLE